MALFRLFPRSIALVILSLCLQPALAEEALSLREAVSLALYQNPSVAAGDLGAEASRHAARGARALANPEIAVSPNLGRVAGTDAEFSLSQPFEINGSRRVRGQIAAQEAAGSRAEALKARRDLILQVRQTYWDTVRAQESVKLQQANTAYLERLAAVSQRQFEVGAIPGTQRTKAQVELSRARQELVGVELALAQSRAALNALLNRPKDAPFLAADSLSFEHLPPDRSRLLATALAQRPEVAAAQAAVAAAEGEARAARLLRAPDLALLARRETLQDNTGVAVAIQLPLLDWGSARGQRRRAEATARRRQKELEAARNQVALEVEQAAQAVASSEEIIAEYQGGILLQSEQLAAQAQTGYDKGATNYLEVLEAQRTLRAVKTDYLSALADHAKALAQLEWATNIGFSDAKTVEAGS